VSDIAIRARDLRKVYRLYSKPSYRFLDMFGMLSSPKGKYTEHAALNGVSLDIGRGEKVAIIGRNGAGKSTFLKLVTNVIEPTSGTLEVHGTAHALLQIGTGFHPDFTGRENVFAYLAQLGVTGAEAVRRCAEVIDFAELEEYIDQPVKTYSTGMAVRLMFSTSTAITPDLLVLDEVLGVGDAYFAHKSYERIRALCEAAGTTLLLVTHDVYSAVKLCERIIWIDHGRVLMDGGGKAVVHAYEDSIRQQEEQRLRIRAQQRLRDAAAAGTSTPVLVEVSAAGNVPQTCPVYIARLELIFAGKSFPLPLGKEAFNDALPARLVREGTAWGDERAVDGRLTREFKNHGTVFHKVAGTVMLPGVADLDRSTDWSIEIEYYASAPIALVVSVHSGGAAWSLGQLPSRPGEWNSHRAARSDVRDDVPAAPNGRPSAAGGASDIAMLSVEAVDSAGAAKHVFQFQETLELHIRYHIRRRALKERAQVLVAFHRDGVDDVCRALARDLMFDGTRMPEGTIVCRFNQLRLGVGAYTVTVMIAREGYFDTQQALFYSINPDVYSILSRVTEIVVEGGGIVASGTRVVADASWSLGAAQLREVKLQ
jgi:lipopolysaccharide transport system ATP-binding protein